MEKTTEDNSAKLDELLKVVQNITADAGSSQEIGKEKNMGVVHFLVDCFVTQPVILTVNR